MQKVHARHQAGFIHLVVVGVILLVLSLSVGAYFLGRQSGGVGYKFPFKTPESKLSAVPVNTSTLKEEKSEDSGIEVEKYTISFARDGEQVFLRYRDEYYAPPVGNQYGINELTTGLYNADSLTWIGLINPLDDMDHGGFDDILSFKVLPGNKNFIFTTRWEKHDGDKTYWFINIFYYDQDLGKNKLVNLFSSNSKDTGKLVIPIVDQISNDGKYVSFNMHPCWNCDGRPTEKMLLNLETNQFKKINWVLEFKWENNGKYFYKDYIEKECTEPAQGPCIEDPKDLPVKQGQF